MRRRPVLLVNLFILLGSLIGLGAAPAHAIVGGSNAITNSGAVSIYLRNQQIHWCTGTLIDPEWVATAAHCVYGFLDPSTGGAEVRVGGTSNTQGYTSYTVRSGGYRWHPEFNPNNGVADIMLMRLATPVPASVQQPAKWRTASAPVGTINEIAGWGWTCDGPAGLPCSTYFAGPLQRLSTVVLPDTACEPTYFTDPARQVCFESATGENAMACRGDSGAGGFTKGLAPDERVLRFVISGDGDDARGASCSTAPDGSNGLGSAIDVAPFMSWMENLVFAVSPSATRAALTPPPMPADMRHTFLPTR